MRNRYLSETTFEITADSEPVLDGWGWDDYWSPDDWIKWHKLQKKEYGLATANKNLITAYQDASIGAASYDWRTFNTDFKNYAKLNKFYDGLFDGIAGLIVKPISTATSVVDNVEKGADRTSKVMSYILPVGIGLVVVGGVVVAYKHYSKK